MLNNKYHKNMRINYTMICNQQHLSYRFHNLQLILTVVREFFALLLLLRYQPSNLSFLRSVTNDFIFSEGPPSFHVRDRRFNNHRTTNQPLSSIHNSITSDDNNYVASVTSTGECKSKLYMELC
jgi:hypothetical protein